MTGVTCTDGTDRSTLLHRPHRVVELSVIEKHEQNSDARVVLFEVLHDFDFMLFVPHGDVDDIISFLSDWVILDDVGRFRIHPDIIFLRKDVVATIFDGCLNRELFVSVVFKADPSDSCLPVVEYRASSHEDCASSCRRKVAPEHGSHYVIRNIELSIVEQTGNDSNLIDIHRSVDRRTDREVGR